MKNKSRRYEILLPSQFNDGAEIPDDLLGEATDEFVEHFGAVSFEKQIIDGQWREGGTLFRDKLSKLVLDVADTADTRKWMKAYRDRWKARLNQLELWLVSFAITIE